MPLVPGHLFLATAVLLSVSSCCKQSDNSDPPPIILAVNSPDSGPTSLQADHTTAPPSTAVPVSPGVVAMGNDGLPLDIPSARSSVPTLAEWNSVPREITVNRSTPLNCETKMLREWLRVSCREKNNTGGTPVGVQKVRGCTPDSYTYADPKQKLTSAVLPVLRGRQCAVDYSWTDKKQTLVVDWAQGTRPQIRFEGPWP